MTHLTEIVTAFDNRSAQLPARQVAVGRVLANPLTLIVEQFLQYARARVLWIALQHNTGEHKGHE